MDEQGHPCLGSRDAGDPWVGSALRHLKQQFAVANLWSSRELSSSAREWTRKGVKTGGGVRERDEKRLREMKKKWEPYSHTAIGTQS